MLQNCKDEEQRNEIENLMLHGRVDEAPGHIATYCGLTIDTLGTVSLPSPWEPVVSTMPSQRALPPDPAQLCD